MIEHLNGKIEKGANISIGIKHKRGKKEKREKRYKKNRGNEERKRENEGNITLVQSSIYDN